MRLFLTAGPAFVLAALLTGQLTPSPHWQVVKADIHQAQPQAKVKAELQALFHPGKV